LRPINSSDESTAPPTTTAPPGANALAAANSSESGDSLATAIWIGPARGAMDELKEAQAAAKRIEIGVSNESIECAAMTGESRDQVYDQQVREINQRKADGTWELRPTGTVRVTPATDPNAKPVPPSDPSESDVDPDAGN